MRFNFKGDNTKFDRESFKDGFKHRSFLELGVKELDKSQLKFDKESVNPLPPMSMVY